MLWIKGKWVTAVTHPNMRFVNLAEWQEVCDEVAAYNTARTEFYRDIADRALLSFRDSGKQSRLEANVVNMAYGSEKIVAASNNIQIKFVERATPTVEGRLLATDTSSRDGSYPTNPDLDFDVLKAGAIVPTEEDLPLARIETDLGLDNADIDQDGDPLETGAEPGVPEDPDADPDEPSPEVAPQKPEPGTAPVKAKPADADFFRPQPTRKDRS